MNKFCLALLAATLFGGGATFAQSNIQAMTPQNLNNFLSGGQGGSITANPAANVASLNSSLAQSASNSVSGGTGSRIMNLLTPSLNFSSVFSNATNILSAINPFSSSSSSAPSYNLAAPNSSGVLVPQLPMMSTAGVTPNIPVAASPLGFAQPFTSSVSNTPTFPSNPVPVSNKNTLGPFVPPAPLLLLLPH